MRQLNSTDKEILKKIKELQLFVCDRVNDVSDIQQGQVLIDNIQFIHLVWRKGSILGEKS